MRTRHGAGHYARYETESPIWGLVPHQSLGKGVGMDMKQALKILRASVDNCEPELATAIQTVLDEIKSARVVVESDNLSELHVVAPLWLKVVTSELDKFSGVNALIEEENW